MAYYYADICRAKSGAQAIKGLDERERGGEKKGGGRWVKRGMGEEKVIGRQERWEGRKEKEGQRSTRRESGKNGSLLLVAYNAGDPGCKVIIIISSLEFLTLFCVLVWRLFQPSSNLYRN